jgi:hypothetical protein
MGLMDPNPWPELVGLLMLALSTHGLAWLLTLALSPVEYDR